MFKISVLNSIKSVVMFIISILELCAALKNHKARRKDLRMNFWYLKKQRSYRNVKLPAHFVVDGLFKILNYERIGNMSNNLTPSLAQIGGISNHKVNWKIRSFAKLNNFTINTTWTPRNLSALCGISVYFNSTLDCSCPQCNVICPSWTILSSTFNISRSEFNISWLKFNHSGWVSNLFC